MTISPRDAGVAYPVGDMVLGCDIYAAHEGLGRRRDDPDFGKDREVHLVGFVLQLVHEVVRFFFRGKLEEGHFSWSNDTQTAFLDDKFDGVASV